LKTREEIFDIDEHLGFAHRLACSAPPGRILQQTVSKVADIDEQAQTLTVRESVYDGTFGTPKTAAGCRQIPLSDTSLRLVVEWRGHVTRTDRNARSNGPVEGQVNQLKTLKRQMYGKARRGTAPLG
jgi:hypothetical protein